MWGMKQTLILVILDGWGIGAENESNPIYRAQPQTIKFIEANFPAGALQASGLAVGLPWEEEGSSEVGHLTLGAGRVLEQYFLKISGCIEDGSFFENPKLKEAFAHAKKNNSAAHLVGLFSEGNVHSSLKHLSALLEMAKREGASRVFLQLFSDGRDSKPRSVLEALKKFLGENILASLSGRFYAMNRDGHWERTEKVYRVLTEGGQALKTPEELTKAAYARDFNDEFIEPAATSGPHPIAENDAVIFFNFREDSIRQISEPFLNPTFDKFPVKNFKNLSVVTMTKYQEEFEKNAAFTTEKIENTLGKVLADAGKIQLRIAETAKYTHITYFFDGYNDKPFANEYGILVPSEKLAHPEEHPAMMAETITDRAVISLNEGGFDFILVNYGNPDITAHTKNYNSVLEAVKVIDRELERLMKSALGHEHILLITSDHGNAENLIDLKTGEPETKHNPNPVPFYLVGKQFQKSIPTPEGKKLEIIGMLSDVAPTILELMRLSKPPEMTGQSLLEQLI